MKGVMVDGSHTLWNCPGFGVEGRNGENNWKVSSEKQHYGS
jgi:hypothetical protein